MIGLFLGDTDFSDIVLSKIKKQNIEYFIIDFSKKNKFKKDKHSFKISIGKFGAIINLIKQKKCKKVLFPLPEAPTIAIVSPAATVRLISLST